MTTLISWADAGITRSVLTEGDLPTKHDKFVWRDKDGNETTEDLPKTLEVVLSNGPGLMLIIR